MNIRLPLSVILILVLISQVTFAGEISYPWGDIYIGALDAAGWAGLVLAAAPDDAFAFRVRVIKAGEAAEGYDFQYLVSELGPHSPDGKYARVKFDLGLPFGQGNNTPILKKPSPKSTTMLVEWSRQDEGAVIGRIRIPRNIQAQLVFYGPWKTRARFQIQDDGQVHGESLDQGNLEYLFWTSLAGMPGNQREGAEVALDFPPEKAREVYFVAGVDQDLQILTNRIYRYKNENTIRSFLEEEARIYEENRVRVSGPFDGVAAAVTNTVFWATLYQPEMHQFFTPASRGPGILRTDGSAALWEQRSGNAFYNAVILAVESSKHAVDMIKCVLQTQYPNGNIPQWRDDRSGSPDRSQPPVGSYMVYKLFQKTGDVELLRFAYPYLTRWHAFWKAEKSNGLIRRDGNRDGLLEWGSDEELVRSRVSDARNPPDGKERARWESAMPDLPNWDEAGFYGLSGTLTLNCLDLNSLYALDAWCLSNMARVLERPEDERREYLTEYAAMKELINETFWDNRRGFYFDRNWDGRLSSKMSISGFLPLIARIPDQRRLEQMRRHLLNPEEFWGEFVLPSVSRGDEEFRDQHDWRGAIWPTANYLVYQGLKAYGLDVEAHEMARKCADLFLMTWNNFQLNSENYDARTGEATGRRFLSWGSLMALMALEEYIDITPWEGFRFGILQPEKGGEVKAVSIQGRQYDIKVSPGQVLLKEEGREIVRSKGSAVFRRFLYNEQEVSFDVLSLAPRKIRIRFLSRGKYQYFLDDQLTQVFDGADAEFRVPEGAHKVSIILVEKSR